MKFLRTSSSGRLLAMIAGLIVAVGAGTALAVAATNSSPVPQAKALAQAVQGALKAPAVKGITADINFTNNLISSANVTGIHSDPILQGATGRLWLADHKLRLELQSGNGDAQVVVDNNSFWISDPTSSTVYKGRLPADKSGSASPPSSAAHGIPTIAQIQSEITRLMKRVTLAGASTSNPTDVAGRPAYSVSISPKHDGGQLGSLQLAWDAIKGVPLDVAVYARNNTTPVLELKASNISYGAVPASNFVQQPPAGYKVVQVSTSGNGSMPGSATKAKTKHADVNGVSAVSRHVPFTLVAPSTLVGLPRHGTTLLSWGGKPAALLTYGQGLGGLAVIEQSGSSSSSSAPSAAGPVSHLSLPTVSIKGASGQELDTPLGTLVRFTRGGVAYTVIGSVAPFAADQAARALTP